MSAEALERRVVRVEEDGRAIADSVSALLDAAKRTGMQLSAVGLRLSGIESTQAEIQATLAEILRRLPPASEAHS